MRNDAPVAEVVRLHPTVVHSIKEHSRQQEAKGGYEAVGFIAAQRGIGVGTLHLNNHAADPQTHFFVEPWEQFRAEQTLVKRGYQVLGFYHSHPTSEAQPSATDLQAARSWPGGVMLIYSVIFDDLRAYREQDGNLEPILLTTEGEPDD